MAASSQTKEQVANMTSCIWTWATASRFRASACSGHCRTKLIDACSLCSVTHRKTTAAVDRIDVLL